MKFRGFVVLFITVALISTLAATCKVQAQVYTQYSIKLNSNGSADWTIKQVSGTNGSVDSWVTFQDKVTTLANAAANQTNRPMGISYETLQMSTSELTINSHTTKYTFTWLNFSQTQNTQLNIGDVFTVSNFFSQLYNDGALQISYPANYTVKSVTPVPDQEDAPDQTMQWFGTQFFITGKPSIVLQIQQQMAANSWEIYVFIGTGLGVAIAGIAGGFAFVNRYKNQKAKLIVMPVPTFVETQEQKVLQVLRKSGGSANQSAIKEQFNFSKAKTSQLLTNLEKKGVVRRDKKGRDKIVILNEPSKGK